MTITRFISRFILQKHSPSSAPRWLCTAAAEELKAAEAEVGSAQHKKKNRLFYQVVKGAKSDKSSLSGVLDNWVNQGNPVKKFDILNLTNYFRTRKNFQAALQLYDWLDSSKLEITNADKAVRINLLHKAKGLSSAQEFFNTLQESEKTSKTYGALLCSYCKENDLDKAIEIFDTMKASNYATTLNYNNLLLLYYSTGKQEKVVSLVQEMEKTNVDLDLYTYNMLINSYAALKNLDAVEGVLEKMKSNNVEGDLFTYGNLATVYLNSGMHEKANEFLEMMEKMETQPDKNVFEACRTRIKLYSEMNNLAGVQRAWETLKSAFPKPNNTSYLFMLLALSKLGEQEGMEKLFKEWKENCSFFDFRVPNVLLEYYLSREMIEEATSLFKGLENRVSNANLRTLNLIATLSLKTKDIDSGLKYLEMGLNKTKDLKSNWFPTEETVKLFLKYFEENNDPDRAERFAEKMKGIKRVNSDDDALAVDAKAADV